MTWQWTGKHWYWLIDDKLRYDAVDYQRDMDEEIERMSLGGQWYDPFDMGPQTSVGKKS